MGFTIHVYVLTLLISLKVIIVHNYDANGMYDLQI